MERTLKILKEKIGYDGKFISVVEKEVLCRDGTISIWETVKRKTFGKIVAIFALTKEREVILEKVFRVPLGGYNIEFPAGLMDRRGEDPRDAVKRELLEETGYTFEGWPELILEGPYNAGLLTDEISIYFAKDVEKVAEPQLENTENITVIKVPLDQLIDFCTTPSPDYKVDLKTLSILPVLEKRKLI